MLRTLLRRGCALVLVLGLISCEPKEAPVANVELDIPAQQTPERLTVIFVHGVLGNASATWQAASAPAWPQILAADPQFGKTVHVMSLAYLSEPLGSASSIHEIATRLGTRLHDRVFPTASKVVFVTHSMGGLVGRHMLLQLARQWPDDYAKVRGIFFLATPSGGSDIAALSSWVSSNPQFSGMSPIELNTFLQSEEDDWAALLRKRTSAVPYPQAYCAYEKLPYGRVTAVPRNRALIGCDETAVPFDRNHIDLVKPQNSQDEVYQFVTARLLRLSKDAAVPLKVTASLEDGLGREIGPDANLATGEYYAIRLSASRPVWFYVFNEDGLMKLERYFPSTAGGQQTEPATSLRIPQDLGKSFQLDSQVGLERLTVLATPTGRNDLAALYAEVNEARQRAIQEWGRSRGLTRGAVIVKDPAFQAEVRTRKLLVDTRPGEEIASLVFRHVHAVNGTAGH